MRRYLTELFRNSRPERTVRRPARKPLVERLEDRTTPSFTAVGSEFHVNTFTTVNQISPQVAANASGAFVVVWESKDQEGAGSGYGVFAQRFNSAGVAQGVEFQVNQFTTNNQRAPSVALDTAGNFTIAWESNTQDGAGYGVYARRYNSGGAPLANEFQVSTITEGNQRTPHVAMDGAGDSVIVYNDSYDGSGYGVFARRFNVAGAAQGAQFQINQQAFSSQRYSSVAMESNGDFVVAWQSYYQEEIGNFSYGVFARRFNAAGVALGNDLHVNEYETANQIRPSIASDSTGNFVVAWESLGQDGSSYGIYARRFDSAGAPLGGEFHAASLNLNDQRDPQVTMDSGGDFAITWSDSYDGSSSGVFVREFTSAGLPVLSQEIQVNTLTTSAQNHPWIAMNAAGDAIVVWQSYAQAIPGSQYEIQAQRYIQASETVPPRVTVLRTDERTVIDAGGAVGSAGPTALVVEFSENLSQAGGAGGANSVLNPANYALTRNGSDITSLISGISFGMNTTSSALEATIGFSRPLPTGTYVLTVRTQIRDTFGNGIDGDGNGSAGPDFTRTFTVLPVRPGAEMHGNAGLAGTQVSPRTVFDAAGNYVMIWRGDDGNANGIFGRQFNAADVPLGPEFRINDQLFGNQTNPAVASSNAGDFVVTWQSNTGDGGGYGIFARRYTIAGVPLGNAFQVNQVTTGNQRNPDVASDSAGNFVVTWDSIQDSGNYGVYARRYNAAGAAQGNEFQVNTLTSGAQVAPRIAMNAAGDFVIAYDDNYNDGFTQGVFARRFTSAGAPLGAEFVVNQFTTNLQNNSTVAMNAAGDFVVAWQSYEQVAGGQYDIFARRYNAAGVAQGGEFQVSLYTTGYQSNPSAGIDSSGNFVVSWESVSSQDGSGPGIYARQFNANGTPRGGELPVNVFRLNQQRESNIAMQANGDYLVAWQSNQDGGSYGIYYRSYRNLAPTSAGIAAVSVLEDATPTVVNLQTVYEDRENLDGELVYSIASNTNTGLVNASITGGTNLTLTYIGQQNGLATVTVRATDPSGKFTDTSIAITVTAVNDAPNLSATNPPTVNEDTGAQTVASWATFNAGQPNEAQSVVAYYITNVTNPGLFSVLPSVATNGTLTYTAAPNAAGTAQFTVIVRDNGGTANNGADTSTPQNFTITVANVNDAPVLFIPSAASVGEGSTLTFTAVGADPFDNPANSLTYSLVTPPPGATINATTGAFSFTPPNGPQVYNISIRVTDNGAPNLSATQVFVLTVTNYPPTLPSAPAVFAPIAGYVATGNFIDPGADSWTGTVNYGDGTGTGPLSINQAAHTFALNHVYATAGVYTVNITVTDSDGATGTQQRQVTVVAPARVASTLVNGNTTQNRSRVTSLVVNFDTIVSLPGTIANAFTLTRTGGGAVSFSASSQVVGGRTVVTLDNFTGAETQSGSLRDGRYTLSALSAQITEPNAGQQLDGDGNGTAGGNYTFGDAQGLYRFYGDVSGLDRRIDISDFGFFSLAYLSPGNYNPVLDFNSDGRIDITDFGQFSVRYFTNLP